MRPLLLAATLLLLAACAGSSRDDDGPRPVPEPPRLALEPQASGTDALLQAVSAVSDRVVWASGHRGAVVRTLDGGATWAVRRVPDADSLQFRDIHAIGADTAWIMSAGTGTASRIYRTTDGGGSWTLQHVNPDSAGFYDCMAFWDASRGFVYGDAVNGRLVVRLTVDGGESWLRVPVQTLPAAQPGEGGFAASGTCAIASERGRAWIGTGNAARSRVLLTRDGGYTWVAVATPIPAGDAAGIATLARSDDGTLWALGGDVGRPDAEPAPVARSIDGGASWSIVGRAPFAGAIYGSAAVPRRVGVLVAVSPRGLAVSRDAGASWAVRDTSAFWAVDFAPDGTGWAAGPRGRLVRLVP